MSAVVQKGAKLRYYICILFLIVPIVYAENAQPRDLIFNLNVRNLPIEEANTIPGVKSLSEKDGFVAIVWQPYNDEPWNSGKKWKSGAEKFYDLLAIKSRIGNTEWTHGGIITNAAGDVMADRRGRITFGIMFNDLTSKRNEALEIRCFTLGSKEQVEHEMLRNIPGAAYSIAKFSRGFVIVVKSERGTFVVWPVNDYVFVRIDNVIDKDLIEAYVNRLGSSLPKDYIINDQQWIENEITWRIQQLNGALLWEKQTSKPFVHVHCALVTRTFPDVFVKYGLLKEIEENNRVAIWLSNVRSFLWENRRNFRFDGKSCGFILKGRDLYDPLNPEPLPASIAPP